MAVKKPGEILKEHRQQRDLSLQDLSTLTGVSTSYLARIEKGDRHPSADVLRRIADPLGFTEAELLKLVGYLSPDYIDDRIARFKTSLKAEIDTSMGTLKEKIDSL